MCGVTAAVVDRAAGDARHRERRRGNVQSSAKNSVNGGEVTLIVCVLYCILTLRCVYIPLLLQHFSMADIEALILETIEIMGPLIAKPKKSDKYLRKPLFRYLHDIVVALVEAHQFPKRLTAPDLDHNNFTEKARRLTCCCFAVASDCSPISPPHASCFSTLSP